MAEYLVIATEGNDDGSIIQDVWYMSKQELISFRIMMGSPDVSTILPPNIIDERAEIVKKMIIVAHKETT